MLFSSRTVAFFTFRRYIISIMQNFMPHKPELLAPAGNAACALAAYDAGADAVYAGLKRFISRDRTVYFTPDEMARVIRYSH